MTVPPQNPAEPYRPAARPSGTQEVAKQEANQVKETAVGAGQHVASTAQVEARKVAGEAKDQFRSLFDQGMGTARTQAAEGQNRLAVGLKGFADELHEMSSNNAHAGTATRLTAELADRGQRLATYLERHEPDDVLREVRRFAARQPFTFLAICAGAGLLVGRFARSMREDAVEEDERYRTRAVGYADPRYADPGYRDLGQGSYDERPYRSGPMVGSTAPGTVPPTPGAGAPVAPQSPGTSGVAPVVPGVGPGAAGGGSVGAGSSGVVGGGGGVPPIPRPGQPGQPGESGQPGRPGEERR